MIKTAVLTLCALLSFSVFAAFPVFAADGDGFKGCYSSGGSSKNISDSPLCKGAEASRSETPAANSLYGANGILTKITNLVSLAVGVAAVVMIIIGGIRYVLSSGDSQNVEGAKNTILYALIGLLVSIFAQLIVIFILNKL